MATVFISHAVEDREVAAKVLKELEVRRGWKCWIAPRDVSDPSYVLAINAGIRESMAMVVLVSRPAVGSYWVPKEVAMAVKRPLPLFALQVEEDLAMDDLGELDLLLANIDIEPAYGRSRAKQIRLLANKLERLDLPPSPAAEPGATRNAPRVKRIANPTGVSGQAEFRGNLEKFCGKVRGLNWLLYDPTEYNPDSSMPSEASLREDLRVLSEAGFDGLFTMTCRGACADAARLAHELGFGLVVLGVYSPGDKAEVEQAKRAAPYADAYCLGHERLGEDYDRETLRQLMSTFRRETHKPVTTTAVLADYANDPQLYMEWSDFLCPDVHASWHYGQPAQEAWEETEQMGLHAATLATPYPGKPVLLKMVSYPSAGAEGLSPTSQLEFYRRATGAMQHSVRFPRGVTPVFLGAFDAPWKDAAHGWPESERHTGLFTADRQPKPAALEIPWPMLHRSKAPVSLRR